MFDFKKIKNKQQSRVADLYGKMASAATAIALGTIIVTSNSDETNSDTKPAALKCSLFVRLLVVFFPKIIRFLIFEKKIIQINKKKILFINNKNTRALPDFDCERR